MGLYDRDYIRFGPRSQSGLGNLRFISFNTWLIIINVAVFVVGQLLASSSSPALRRALRFEPVFQQGVSLRDQQQAVEARDAYNPKNFAPQVVPLYLPIPDPATNSVQLIPIGTRQIVSMPILEYYGHFSTARIFGHSSTTSAWPNLEIWRFMTFQFLHANVTHLLFNMMGLWFVGGLVEQYLGSKRYAAFYLVCGVFGALMYLFLNLIGYIIGPGVHIPALLFGDINTPLVGASAGIFGVLMAAAFIAPTAIVQVMFIIPMKMRTAVYLFMAVTIYQLVTGGSNQGGEAAHVGGAIAGYYFIRRTHLLRDFFDFLGDSRKPKGSPPSKPRQSIVSSIFFGASSSPERAEVDRILAKVNASGLHSLTDGEKRTLRRATESRQRG